MGEKFFIQEYVRWSDVDYAGLICYGSYLRFFEMAETELFRSMGMAYGEVFEKFDIWLPRVQLHCDFHHPAYLDDLLKVSAYIGRLGNSSLTLNFEVHRLKDNQLMCDGRFIMVAVDRKSFQSKPLPKELVTALTRYTILPVV